MPPRLTTYTPWTATAAEILRAMRHVRAPRRPGQQPIISLREIARHSGVSHAELARIAGGKRNATLNVATRLVQALRAVGKVHRRAATTAERAALRIEKKMRSARAENG